jgi:hypothetical protein
METVKMKACILLISVGTLFAIALAAPVMAQKKYDPGATDTEIKIGNIMPYTGSFSEYAAIGRAEAAYFQMINDRGGVNGRKISFVSVDDGTDPKKTVEQARKLVEQDEVLLIVGSWGSGTNKAIRKAYDIDWHPMQFIPNTSISIGAFLDPAGIGKAFGIISNARSKGWTSPQSKHDPAVLEFLEWMRKYNPKASDRDASNVYGYEVAQTMVEVLKKCGDDLTRANVMKQATSLDLELGMLSPGIRISTSPTDYRPIKELYLIKFNGKDWAPLGRVTGR